jgi:hypothetical protein
MKYKWCWLSAPRDNCPYYISWDIKNVAKLLKNIFACAKMLCHIPKRGGLACTFLLYILVLYVLFCFASATIFFYLNLQMSKWAVYTCFFLNFFGIFKDSSDHSNGFSQNTKHISKMFRVFDHLLLVWLIYISLSFNLQVESRLLYLVHEWASIKEELMVNGYRQIDMIVWLYSSGRTCLFCVWLEPSVNDTQALRSLTYHIFLDIKV